MLISVLLALFCMLAAVCVQAEQIDGEDDVFCERAFNEIDSSRLYSSRLRLPVKKNCPSPVSEDLKITHYINPYIYVHTYVCIYVRTYIHTYVHTYICTCNTLRGRIKGERSAIYLMLHSAQCNI